MVVLGEINKYIWGIGNYAENDIDRLWLLAAILKLIYPLKMVVDVSGTNAFHCASTLNRLVCQTGAHEEIDYSAKLKYSDDEGEEDEERNERPERRERSESKNGPRYVPQ